MWLVKVSFKRIFVVGLTKKKTKTKINLLVGTIGI